MSWSSTCEACPSCPKLAEGVCDMLQQELDVVMSNQALHCGNFSVSAKDVGLIEFEGRRLICKVGYHVEAGGTCCYIHVTFWIHVHGPMFRVRDDDVAMVMHQGHMSCQPQGRRCRRVFAPKACMRACSPCLRLPEAT